MFIIYYFDLNDLILVLLFALIIAGILLCIAIDMAHKRGRNIYGWAALAFIVDPLLAIILLACLGETEKQRLKRIRKEEELRQSIRNKNTHFNNIR